MSGEMVELKRMATITYGLSQPPPLADEGVPIVRATNIERGKITAKELIFAALDQLPLDRVPLLRAGELLVVRSGAYTGDSALVTPEWERSAPGYDLRVNPTPALEPRFAAYSLLGGVALDHMVLASSRAAQPHLNAEDLGQVPILRLTPREQGAIADFLDRETARIDALISKKRALVDKVDARWRADLLARLAVANEPRLSPMPWLPKPWVHGWAVVPLKRLTSGSWGGDWGSEPGVAELDLPCVRAADFEFSELRAVSGARRSFGRAAVATRLLRPGDLVIEKSGGGEGVPVGRVVAWQGDAAAVPTNFAGGLRPGAGVDAKFVLLVFRAAYEIGLPWRSIKQTTGLQNLDVGHYLAHPWAVPPVEAQRRIADELLQALTTARQVQARLRHQISLLQEHRQALITGAVTGELEVPGVAA